MLKTNRPTGRRAAANGGVWQAVAGAVLILAVPVAASAAPSGAISPLDKKFATTAAEGGLAEVRAAHMAMKKSNNAAVDSFAQRMISDHSRANDQLASIMKREDLSVPTTIDPIDRKAARKLQGLSGHAFDAAYLSAQKKAHQRTIALFREEAMKGTNPPLVSFAKSTLPTLMEHLTIDRRDLTKVDGAPVAQR